jgi:hypothetical protein
MNGGEYKADVPLTLTLTLTLTLAPALTMTLTLTLTLPLPLALVTPADGGRASRARDEHGAVYVTVADARRSRGDVDGGLLLLVT